MTTFDEIVPIISDTLREQDANLQKLGAIVVNRDLNGRVRLIVDKKIRDNGEAFAALETIARLLATRLAPHSVSTERMVLVEDDLEIATRGAPHFLLPGFTNVTMVDRLAVDTDWATIAPIADNAPRIVFYSIKGGVGRSTALAVTAWSLAQRGKRVLVLDLDLESPGLSSSLLPPDRRPTYGIADWLVEDLIDNGATIRRDMVTMSNLSHDGEIHVVPAHGREPGEYVAKLGRAWMSKIAADGTRESWPARLARLLNDLEENVRPDVILIDARAGIDEVASACITNLGVRHILLFALDGEQTWSGYRILFRHWHQAGVAKDIRERLQLVGAMIPELGGAEYFDQLREHAWNVFRDELYDEVPAGEPVGERFSFDDNEEGAPHYPWPIKWHRGFAALQSLHSRFEGVDPDEVTAIFGGLIEGVRMVSENTKS